MKGFLYHPNTQNLSSSLPLHNTSSHPLVLCQSCVPRNFTSLSFKVSHSWPKLGSCSLPERTGNGIVVGCASWGSVTELGREMEAEMKRQEDEDESRFINKCGERKGIVELLECLETEAIMGEDVGKEPTDYNRRAQIFDRSSRVFQALREPNNDDVLPQESSE